jgi:hypothetical protein
VVQHYQLFCSQGTLSYSVLRQNHKLLANGRIERMRVMGARISVGLLIGVCQVLFAAASLQAQDYTRGAKPPLFSYDELVQLGSGQELSSGIAEKLHVISTTPFINNEAYYGGARPRPLVVEGLGPTLRVAFWNIERGLELDDIQLFLTDASCHA